MRSMVTRLMKDEAGQDLIEYALLAAFIALGSVVAMQAVGTGVLDLFNSIKAKLQSAAGPAAP